MKENQPKIEMSEQFQLSLAYFNFVRLAQTYGQDPSKNSDAINPDLSPLLSPETKTLRALVPADNNSSHNHSDFISGVDYGSEYNVLEIFYRKGEFAAKLTLKLNEKTGDVKMHRNSIFKVNHLENSEHQTFEPGDNKINLKVGDILGLLEKAEVVLEKQENEKLKLRFDKPKLTKRQKLSKRILGLIK